MRLEDLIPNKLYRLLKKNTLQYELAVFLHISQTGMPVFRPDGEFGMQDWFGLKNHEEYDIDDMEKLRRENDELLKRIKPKTKKEKKALREAYKRITGGSEDECTT